MAILRCDVVVVAPTYDLHASAVINCLKRRGATVGLASFRELTKRDAVAIHGADTYTSVIRIGGKQVDLTLTNSIWWRRAENPIGRPDGSTKSWFMYHEWQSLLFSLEAACCCKWINRPSAAWLAKRKVLQMAEATRVGLRTPATLVTNDPAQVLRFREQYPKVVYKTMGETSHQNTATRLLTVDDLGRLDMLVGCPAIFQEFIEAQFDLRVTIIGDRVFTIRIDSQSGASPLDWRFDHSVAFENVRLDPQVERDLLLLIRQLGLTYGAIDLRQTPEGEHVFLEVNPAGQYLFAELLTGTQISEAMADELLSTE